MRSDITSLPLPDGTADATVASMVLHHVREQVAMLAEMARVVRPGGVAAITDCVEHGHEWLRAERADVWLVFNRDTLGELFADAGLVQFDPALLGTA